MPVKGKSVEFRDYTKKVGLFEGKILAINPSDEELNEIIGENENRKPVEYMKENDEGDTIFNLTVWVEDIKTEMKASVKIPIIDKPVTSKDGEKTIYINTQGNASYYIDSAENLPEWFRRYDHWQAKQGEDKLYSFLRAWLQIDTYNDKGAEMYVDIKKILRGNVKELKDFLKTEHNHTVLFNSIIATKTITDEEGNESVRYYQNIWNKNFLPGSSLKFFKLGGKMPKSVKKYIEDAEGSIKDYYILEPLRDYNPEENVVSGNEALINSDDPAY